MTRETTVRTVAAQLRGVKVTCIVEHRQEREPVVSIETCAGSLEDGLRAVSRFAGYCRRTLVLASPGGDEEQWAEVLASYYGFGLAIDDEGQRRGVMPPPELDAEGDGEPRRRFLQRVMRTLGATA